MKDFLSNNAFSIATVVFFAIGSYFMLQSHEDKIIALEAKIEELEENKVSKDELALKETFAAAQMNTIKADIAHIDQRLDKKIKVINGLKEDLNCISEQTAVQEQRIEQNEGELGGLWGFTNKFLEEL